MCDILNQKQPGGAVKKGATTQSRINQTTRLVGMRNDIMLRPSRLKYYHDQFVKQLVKTRIDIKSRPVNAVLPMHSLL